MLLAPRVQNSLVICIGTNVIPDRKLEQGWVFSRQVLSQRSLNWADTDMGTETSDSQGWKLRKRHRGSLGFWTFVWDVSSEQRPNYKAEVVVGVYFTRSNCVNTKCKFELETIGEKCSPLVLQEQLEYKLRYIWCWHHWPSSTWGAWWGWGRGWRWGEDNSDPADWTLGFSWAKNNHDDDDDDDENDENVNNDDDHFTCTAPLRCVCEVSSSGRASPPKGSVGEHHFDFKFLDEDDKDDHREWWWGKASYQAIIGELSWKL